MTADERAALVDSSRELCREEVPGTIPSWAGEDQISPCRCKLPTHHSGSHKCSHIIEKEDKS